MNTSYLIPGSNTLAATHGRSEVKQSIFWLRFFIMLFAAWALLYSSKAYSGQVCMPQGFSIFPSMPGTISLSDGPFGGDFKLLYDTTATAGATSVCTDNADAALDFVMPPLDVFTYEDTTDIWPSASRSRVKLVYTAKTPPSVLTSTYYALMLYYYIEVKCSGANIAAQVVTNGQFRVTGLANCASYTVNYQVSIYQNNGSTPPSTYAFLKESGTRGYRLRTTLSDGSGQVGTNMTTLSGSPNVRYVAGRYCTYSLSRSTVPVGDINHYDLLTYYFGNDFSINIRNCQNATGRTVSVFWRFGNPYPGDSSLMLNSASGGSDSVVGRVDCGGAVARHNERLQLAVVPEGGISVNCYAAIVPHPSISHYTQIQPGPYRGTAYLVFQFE